MKILFWNIQHGGGKRLGQIVQTVTQHSPDLIAFAEYRVSPGRRLVESLGNGGWNYVESTDPGGTQNGLCILSRVPIRRMSAEVPPENALRWINLDIPHHGFQIGVLHIVCAGRSGIEKRRFWDAVLANAKEVRKDPFLFVGDLNTGLHRIDEVGRTFACSEQFRQMTEMGWIDIWRALNADSTEFTWYSKFRGGVRGNGFRVDHAFVSPSLLPRVRWCQYSHVERDAGASDHSLLFIEIEPAPQSSASPV
jgi:exonuclease III